MIGLLLLLPQIVYGHAQLVRSSPSNKADLAQAPVAVELWFNELLEDSFNTLQVFSAQDYARKERKDFADGKPQLDPKDRTHLTTKVKALRPGTYIVEWRVLSRDGHSAPGKFTFQVR
jgi:methionine-rich copper-binding protein CopC